LCLHVLYIGAAYLRCIEVLHSPAPSPRCNKCKVSLLHNASTSAHQTPIQLDARSPKQSVQALHTTKILRTYVQYSKHNPLVQHDHMIFIYILINIFYIFLLSFLWRCGPTRAMASSFLRFLDHTQRRTTVGRTPLDE